MPIIAVIIAFTAIVSAEMVDQPPPMTFEMQENKQEVVITEPEIKEISLKPRPNWTVGNGQCVDYVKYRLGIIGVRWVSALHFWENYEQYGFKQIDEPMLGAVLVTNESSVGHVAIVEDFDDQFIYISEQNYIYRTMGTRTLHKDDDRILGYVIQNM